MSTLAAFLLIIIVSGMLVAYQIGFAAGRREGFEAGRDEGKRQGAMRAYAVGYDRGRRKQEDDPSEGEGDETEPKSRLVWPLIVSLIVVVLTGLLLAGRIGF